MQIFNPTEIDILCNQFIIDQISVPLSKIRRSRKLSFFMKRISMYKLSIFRFDTNYFNMVKSTECGQPKGASKTFQIILVVLFDKNSFTENKINIRITAENPLHKYEQKKKVADFSLKPEPRLFYIMYRGRGLSVKHYRSIDALHLVRAPCTGENVLYVYRTKTESLG